MDRNQLYEKLKDYLKNIAIENDLMKEKVLIEGRVLTNRRL